MIDVERVWRGRSWSDAASARRSRSFRISDFELGTRAIDGVGMTESNAEYRGGRTRRCGISSDLEYQWRVRAYSHGCSLEQDLCGSKVQETRALIPNIVEGLNLPFLFIPE
jgi:hypothetical protein